MLPVFSSYLLLGRRIPDAGFDQGGGGFFSAQPSVAVTESRKAPTMRSSRPINANSDTDLGAEKVMSRPGRCSP
jgi:hypothetical protein